MLPYRLAAGSNSRPLRQDSAAQAQRRQAHSLEPLLSSAISGPNCCRPSPANFGTYAGESGISARIRSLFEHFAAFLVDDQQQLGCRLGITHRAVMTLQRDIVGLCKCRKAVRAPPWV